MPTAPTVFALLGLMQNMAAAICACTWAVGPVLTTSSLLGAVAHFGQAAACMSTLQLILSRSTRAVLHASRS